MSESQSPPRAVPPVNSPEAIDELLNLRRIAVVGLSDSPARTSYAVSEYMQRRGYQITPINPQIQAAIGERAYPDLASLPEPPELVNVFRRSEFVSEVVDQAIAAGAKGIWMQLGVYDHAAAERARAAGIPVVMDRCIMVEHGRHGA